jgi:solute carrier family 41
VAVLLMLSHALVHALWKYGSDPDNAAIPFLTAAGDLLGGLLLAAMFHALHLVGDPNAQKRED